MTLLRGISLVSGTNVQCRNSYRTSAAWYALAVGALLVRIVTSASCAHIRERDKESVKEKGYYSQ